MWRRAASACGAAPLTARRTNPFPDARRAPFALDGRANVSAWLDRPAGASALASLLGASTGCVAGSAEGMRHFHGQTPTAPVDGAGRRLGSRSSSTGRKRPDGVNVKSTTSRRGLSTGPNDGVTCRARNVVGAPEGATCQACASTLHPTWRRGMLTVHVHAKPGENAPALWCPNCKVRAPRNTSREAEREKEKDGAFGDGRRTRRDDALLRAAVLARPVPSRPAVKRRLRRSHGVTRFD